MPLNWALTSVSPRLIWNRPRAAAPMEMSKAKRTKDGRHQTPAPDLLLDVVALGIQGAPDLRRGPAAIVVHVGDAANQGHLQVP
jgi:hypothetical protein